MATKKTPAKKRTPKAAPKKAEPEPGPLEQLRVLGGPKLPQTLR